MSHLVSLVVLSGAWGTTSCGNAGSGSVAAENDAAVEEGAGSSEGSTQTSISPVSPSVTPTGTSTIPGGNPGGGNPGGATGGSSSPSSSENSEPTPSSSAGGGAGGAGGGAGGAGGGAGGAGGGAGGAGGGETSSGEATTDDGPVTIPSDGEVRAFPGAAGFGAMATGGRGGRVIKVTNLNASGSGSLQEALNESGPRIIVFGVSGVIEADILEINAGDVTIAGQTAPGGGITIKGRLFGNYDSEVGNFIIRHIRVRPEYDHTDGSQFDAVQLSLNHTIIMDHVSVGFGIDETVDLYSANNVTVQWSTIESPTPEPSHEGGDHNYGLINGPYGKYITLHHNLFAHSNNRNPAIANGPADVLNNVMYDVSIGFVHHNPASGKFRLIGNYFKDGPNATLIPFYFDDYALDDLGYYISNNWVDGNDSECSAGALDNPWQQCGNGQDHDASFRSTTDFDFSGEEGYRAPTVAEPAAAYAEVLAKVGAFPRDVVTRKSITDAETGGGDWGMELPSNLMEGLTPTEPPTDADNDGIADEWEAAHGLDANDGDDHSTVMESGYTAIEEYINELAERLIQ